MTVYSRNIKGSSGQTDFVGGTPAVGDEVDDDLNQLYTLQAGNIADDNVSGSADIDASKIGDYSANATEAKTNATAGTTASPSLASSLDEELSRLRYGLRRLQYGAAAQWVVSGGAAADMAWQDAPAIGPNLLRNPNLTTRVDSTTEPNHWTLTGNAPTVSYATPAVTEGDGKEVVTMVNVTGGPGQEGFSQAVTGLKASTKYLVGARVLAIVNDVTVTTSGAGSGKDYEDFALTDDGVSGWVTLAGIVETDATPTDLTLKVLTADAISDEIDVAFAFVHELNENPVAESNAPTFIRQVRDAEDNPTEDAWTALSYFDITMHPYRHNQAITATLEICSDDSSSRDAVRLLENASVVAVSAVIGQATISYVNDAPDPGTDYQYTVEYYRAASATRIHPNLGGAGQTESYLTVRMEG